MIIKKENKPTDIVRMTKYVNLFYDRETKIFWIYREDRETGMINKMKLLKTEAGIVQRFIFSMFQKPPLRK